MAAPPFILVGNPDNRRVTLFQDALARQGLPPATVVPWLTLAREALAHPDSPSLPALDRLPGAPALVRLDSTGEDWEVERALLMLGWDEARDLDISTIHPTDIAAMQHDHGRIVCPRQHHLGFLRLLARTDAVFHRRPRWRVLNPPADIAELFDKRITSRRYAALGVPVPRTLDNVIDVPSLAARCAEIDARAAYLKLSCGSSASCLALYLAGSGHLMTTIEQAAPLPAGGPRAARARKGLGGWYNSLRVRRVTDEGCVAEIVDFLHREGSQIEASVPKARLQGRFFDCRVLVVAGEPAFTVVRTSAHPITNLHLGGTRGDPAALAAALPTEIHDAAMASCRAVGRAHGCLHVGVDLLYEAGYRGHRVVEANAFGDLLPNLYRDGLSVYEWEIRAALSAFET